MEVLELEKCNDLMHQLEEKGNSKDARAMEAYLKNKFLMYGLKAGARREIAKPFQEHFKKLPKSYKLEIARYLNSFPYRELHHIAQEIVEAGYKKNIQEDDIYWITELITTNSWWDTVDFMAPRLAGNYFLKFPNMRKSITDEWIASDNIWLIRSAIIFQLKYKTQTDLDFLFEVIRKTCHTKEFFINKAIGWVLRENSRRIPIEIRQFINANEANLSGLSKREALRLIDELN